MIGSTIIARTSAIFLSKPSQSSSNCKSFPFFIPKLQRFIFPKSRFTAFAEGEDGSWGNVSSDERPKLNLKWRALLDPNPENIVAIGLTGLLTWASLQVLWQISFISGAILLAAFGNIPVKMIYQNSTGNLCCKQNNLSTSYMAISTPHQTSSSLYDYEEDLRMNKYYEVELQVKEEDIDSNDIVEASVYSGYCEQAHDEMMKNVGLAIGGNCKSTSLSNFSSKLYTPLKHGDKFSVKVKVSCISTTSIYVETYIFRIPDNELILEAEAEIVLLGKNYRPVRISPGVRAKLLLLDSIDLFD